MSDNTVYTLTEEGNSLIDKSVETMDEWLTSMSDEELLSYHRICDKDVDDRTEDEEHEIYSHALVLYCRELDIDELSITNELLSSIGGYFCTNVIIESLRRKGFVKADGPLLLYKEFTINLTEDGREFMESEKNNE
jgi:predicted transcriptional regulator